MRTLEAGKAAPPGFRVRQYQVLESPFNYFTSLHSSAVPSASSQAALPSKKFIHSRSRNSGVRERRVEAGTRLRESLGLQSCVVHGQSEAMQSCSAKERSFPRPSIDSPRAVHVGHVLDSRRVAIGRVQASLTRRRP